jgi:hypothetical protein
MKKLVILTDSPAFASAAETPMGAIRGIGPYRLRTAAQSAGYQSIVIDFLSEFLDNNISDQLIQKYIDKDTVVAISTTWLCSTPDASASGGISDMARSKIPGKDVKVWFDFLKKLKNQSHLVVFGGANIYHFLNEQHKNLVDFFIAGFGDRDIVHILDWANKKRLDLNFSQKDGFKIIKNNNNFDIQDIKTRFLPDDYLSNSEVLPIEISRGCRFKCKFCYYPLNGRKKNDYIRAADDLYSEFMYNYEHFGTVKYRFLDDTYNESIEKLELVQSVIERLPFELEFESYIRHELLDDRQLELLHLSGLKSAVLGIETLNKQSGESIGKGMAPGRTLDIVESLREKIPDCYISTGIIIGLPYDSIDNLQWAYDLASRSDLFDKINWFPLAIRVKSDLFQLSELEENYASFGYSVQPSDTFKMYQHWVNRLGLTADQALNIAVELEQLSKSKGTSSTDSRYALTLKNLGVKFTTDQDLSKKLAYTYVKYKKNYVKKILGLL